MGAGLCGGQVLHEDLRGGDRPVRVWEGGGYQGLPLGVPGDQAGGGLPEDNSGAEWAGISYRGDMFLPGTPLQQGSQAGQRWGGPPGGGGVTDRIHYTL